MNINSFKEISKYKIDIIGFIIAFFGALFNLPKYFDAYITPLPPANELWASLDPSWMLTINYANINNLAWGTDIAFAYGPLSYLSTRVGWGGDRIDFILFDLFVYLNFFLLYFLSIKLSKNKLITILLIVVACVLIPVLIGSSTALVLMAFLVFWIRMSLEKNRPIYYAFQIILIAVLFFIKFNTGLIAIPLFMAGIIYSIITKKSNIFLLLTYAVSPFIIIYVACQYLNVDIIPYIKSALEIVSGYNDVMFLEHPFKTRLLALFIIFSLSIILVHKLITDAKINRLKNLTILFLYATAIFVLYKSGFVRGMEADFFIFSILIIIGIQDFHFQNYKKYSNIIILVCLSTSIYFVYIVNHSPLTIKDKLDKHYWMGLKDFTPISGMHLFPNNNQLPVSVKEKIGNKPVDVYPWNTQLLFENNLNYLPRPVFQSYIVYTPYLEEMNFKHYNSTKAPEFIIYDYTSIDDRYPMFDESKVNLSILKNYIAVELFDFQNRKVLLLQKKKDFKTIKFIKSKEYAMLFDSPLVVKKDIFYEIGIYNSLAGKLVSIIDHAPEIKLAVNFENGNYREYHIGKELLRTGIFLDKYVVNTEDFYQLFQNDSLQKLEQIKYYNFRLLSPSLFKDKIRITEYKIEQ